MKVSEPVLIALRGSHPLKPEPMLEAAKELGFLPPSTKAWRGDSVDILWNLTIDTLETLYPGFRGFGPIQYPDGRIG